MVINLAAGLDSRPWRMDLPASLQWVEIDLPEILDTKHQMLAKEKPACKLEMITANLADLDRRKVIFSELNQRALKIAVMSEGLLLYLDEEKVTSLSADLLAQPHVSYWLVEVASPRIVEWINRRWGKYFQAGNAVMSFAPADWRTFFKRRGWELVYFENLAETATKLNRSLESRLS